MRNSLQSMVHATLKMIFRPKRLRVTRRMPLLSEVEINLVKVHVCNW